MVISGGYGVFKNYFVNMGIGVTHWRLDLVDTWGKSNIARTLTVCLMSSCPLHMRDVAGLVWCSLFTIQKGVKCLRDDALVTTTLVREAFFLVTDHVAPNKLQLLDIAVFLSSKQEEVSRRQTFLSTRQRSYG